MSKTTWDTAVKAACYDYAHRDTIAYLYGTDGETGSDSLVDKMVAAYPSHFSGLDISAIKKNVKGKKCYDCSGWVHTLFGAPDMSSGTLIDNCTSVTTNLASGPAGSILWKSGHVGIDIGYGYCLDIPNELQEIRFRKISECDWAKSGQLSTYCDYTGATNR